MVYILINNAESTDSGEDDDEDTGGHEDNRNPVNSGGGNQGPPPQNTTGQQVDRPGMGQREDNVMRIHDNRNSQYQNLNNIIRSDNMPQEFKSNESEENLRALRDPNVGQAQYTNQIGDPRYEEMKSEFYRHQNQQNPSRRDQASDITDHN